MKVLNYLYPMENPNQLKVFQGSNSKIRGINFKRNNEVSTYIKNNLNDFATNYGIYVLKSDTDDELNLYIGQSTNGFNRIDGHKEKLFWTEGLLFITENNSWDKTVIDYLEYKLINIFNESKYTLINKDLRMKEPVLDIFQQAKMKDLVGEILFLLASNGIESENTIIEKKYNKKYNNPTKTAKIAYYNGEFILLKNSEIKRPVESSKDWQSSNFHKNGNKKIDNYIEAGKIIEENGKLLLTSDIAFKSPSGAGKLVTGYFVNGYEYWKGLNEIRQGELDG